ncbi:MAG: hypothetical protein MZW92_22185 [Comamonadaceae bacterium]|nr:hypothetical protein [Comamonadaceae bacterium]
MTSDFTSAENFGASVPTTSTAVLQVRARRGRDRDGDGRPSGFASPLRPAAGAVERGPEQRGASRSACPQRR